MAQLPEFIELAALERETSVGENDAIPTVGKRPFEYQLLFNRYSEVQENVFRCFGKIPSVDEAKTLMSQLLAEVVRKETPLRPQLEKLCLNKVNALLAVPRESVNVSCKIVDRLQPASPMRVMPEEDGDSEGWTFRSVDEEFLANRQVLKRRLVNALVQGASYDIMSHWMYDEHLDKWDPELMPLYEKLMLLNDYLLFEIEEKISDRNPKQGSYVQTKIGKGNLKTEINVEALIYPLLLQETIRGFFELFGVHGLPEDNSEAMYIIRRADYIVAEPWDLRIGVPLWERIVDGYEDSTVYPYIFSTIVMLDLDEFNKMVGYILTKKSEGSMWLEDIVQQVIHDREYQLFKNDIEQKNLDKTLITDDDQSEENLSEDTSFGMEDNGEGEMFYPNKQSNLPPDLQRKVRSPQFKAWFGDWQNHPESASKLVDANGEPLIVYHGSRYREILSGFYPEYILWVTPAKDYAEVYVDMFEDDDETEPQSDGMYVLFANARKPLYVGATDDVIFDEDDISSVNPATGEVTEPHYTQEFLNVSRALGLSPEDLLALAKSESCGKRGKTYAEFIWQIVRDDNVHEYIKNNTDYDCLVTYESGNVCFGLLYPENVKSIQCEAFANPNNIYENRG